MNDIGLCALQQVVNIETIYIDRKIVDRRVVGITNAITVYDQCPFTPEVHIILHIYPWQNEEV